MVGSAFGSIQEWIFPVVKGEEKAFFAKQEFPIETKIRRTWNDWTVVEAKKRRFLRNQLHL